MNEELKNVLQRAESDPASTPTLAELASVIRALDSIEAWANTSFRVLNQRVWQLKRKADPVDPGIKQSISQLEREQKQIQVILQKMMLRK
jgi:hypothetical protein